MKKNKLNLVSVIFVLFISIIFNIIFSAVYSVAYAFLHKDNVFVWGVLYIACFLVSVSILQHLGQKHRINRESALIFFLISCIISTLFIILDNYALANLTPDKMQIFVALKPSCISNGFFVMVRMMDTLFPGKKGFIVLYFIENAIKAAALLLGDNR